MLPPEQNQFSAVLVAGALVLGAPLIIGLLLFFKRGKNALDWYAALLTLKPVVATPIWFTISTGNMTKPGAALTLLLPGFLLTVLLALLCRHAFANPDTSGKAKKLLALDCARWLTTEAWLIVALTGFGASQTLLTVCYCSSGLLALAMPTIFAFAAIFIVGKAAPDTATTPP